MNTQADLQSNAAIMSILKKNVDQPNGLHWVLLRPAGPAGAAAEPMQAANDPAINELLAEYGMDHFADVQTQRWLNLTPEVQKTFEALTRIAATDAEQSGLRPTRLVLDVEMGGFLYATVGNHGILFAATLDQQTMNDGSAERMLVKIVSELNAELDKA